MTPVQFNAVLSLESYDDLGADDPTIFRHSPPIIVPGIIVLSINVFKFLRTNLIGIESLGAVPLISSSDDNLGDKF